MWVRNVEIRAQPPLREKMNFIFLQIEKKHRMKSAVFRIRKISFHTHFVFFLHPQQHASGWLDLDTPTKNRIAFEPSSRQGDNSHNASLPPPHALRRAPIRRPPRRPPAMSTASGDGGDGGGGGDGARRPRGRRRRIPPASSMPWVRNLRRFVGTGAGLGSEALMGQCRSPPPHPFSFPVVFGRAGIPFLIVEMAVRLGFTRLFHENDDVIGEEKLWAPL